MSKYTELMDIKVQSQWVQFEGRTKPFICVTGH